MSEYSGFRGLPTLIQLFPFNLLKAGGCGLGLLLHIFKSNDLYLGYLLGIGSAGFQDLNLLVNIGRVEPPAAIAALAQVTLLPDSIKREKIILKTVYIEIFRFNPPLTEELFFLEQIAQR